MFMISHNNSWNLSKNSKKARQSFFLILIRKIFDKVTFFLLHPFKLISKYLHFSRFFDTYNLPYICLEPLNKELGF